MDVRTRVPQRALGAIALLACAIAAAPAGATGRHDDNVVEASLRGYSEVPAVSSAARGRFKAWLDTASNTIRYELSYSGLEAPVRMSHIHLGQRGVNGGIMLWLCGTANFADPTSGAPTCPQSGTVSGVLSMANIVGGAAAQGVAATEFAEFVAAIRAGVTYVNVHTDKFPGGEIRGQLRDD
jgi:hypothetical protein